ncbi:ArnT family glycosyltransferase [Schlesneria sp.]|uniref:ArnT family glycosyltransferase n=1 Tax=Schlesneria sp. TaxID=2762018 RepID=UPI002F1FD01F
MAWAAGWHRWLFLTLFVAFGLRLGLALAVQYEVSKTPGRLCLISGDAEGYWELAGKVAAGEAYSIYDPPRRLLRMPGFPALLALPRLVFGDNPFAARLLLVVVGTLACGLTYWLGYELSGHAVGLLAAIYTAVSPTMALFSVLFLSETAFAATMLASLIAAARFLRKYEQAAPSDPPTVGHAVAVGGLAGLATYMRPTWLLVGPGLAMLTLMTGRSPLGQRAILAGIICLSLAVVLFPWTVRNAALTGHWIPTTLWVGPSLYDGLNPTATGDSDMEFFEQDRLLQSMSEYEMDREYRRRAWKFAAENPARVISLALVKQSRYWSPAPNTPQFRHPLIHLVAWLSFAPLMIFALIGVWQARNDPYLITLTAGPVLYFAALHLLFVGSLRYRLPAEFPLSVLAAVGMVRLFAGSRAAQHASSPSSQVLLN